MKTEDGSGFYNLYECSFCQKKSSEPGNARKHILVVHMKKGKPCPTCGRPHFDDQRLREHIPKCPKRGNRFFQVKNGEKVVKVQVLNNPSSCKNSVSNSKGRGAEGTMRKSWKIDSEKLRVKNPFPNFDLKKALDVQVIIEPLSFANLEEAGQNPHYPNNSGIESQEQCVMAEGENTTS